MSAEEDQPVEGTGRRRARIEPATGRAESRRESARSRQAIETIKEQAGLTGATATDEAASNKEKIAARNATVAIMEAADRLREIGHRLTAEGQPEAADDKYRMVGVYMLRSEPDYVILDVDLGQPGKIGSQEEYDCLGSLPLELHEVDGFTSVRNVGDAWMTTPRTRTVGPQDCAVEPAHRKDQRRRD